MRQNLVNHVTDSAMDRSKRAVPSAFAMGKVLTGITGDHVDLDTMVEPGMTRFGVDATCTASLFPFAGKSGFLSVFTVTPEEDVSQYATLKNVRQVAWLDDTDRVTAYTRTGYYSAEVNDGAGGYVWSNAWVTLGGGDEFGGIYKDDNGDQITNLNLYLKGGTWVVGEPAAGPWVGYPAITDDIKNEIVTSKYWQGFLFVLTEETTGEYAADTTPCYTQILYLYNTEYAEPFVRNRKVDGNWGPWARNGQSAYLAESLTEETYIGDMINPGLYSIYSSNLKGNGGHIHDYDIAELPEVFRERLLVEVKRVDVDRSKPRGEIIRQTIYTGYENSGHVWTRAGSVERDPAEQYIDIDWTPWVRTDGAGFSYAILDNHLVQSDLWNGSVVYNSGKAEVNTIYISNGSWVLELPDPATCALGSQIGLFQRKGEGAVVYTTAANYGHQSALADYTCKEDTAPIYERTPSGAIKTIMAGSPAAITKSIAGSCFYEFTVTEDASGSYYWELETENENGDAAGNLQNLLDGLRKCVNRSIICNALAQSETFEQVKSLSVDSIKSLFLKWPEFNVVVKGAYNPTAVPDNTTITLPVPSSYTSFSTDETVTQDVKEFLINDCLNAGKFDFDEDGETSLCDLASLYSAWAKIDIHWEYDLSNITAEDIQGVLLEDNGTMYAVNEYPGTVELARRVLDTIQFMMAKLTDSVMTHLIWSKQFVWYLVDLYTYRLFEEIAKRQQLRVNVTVEPNSVAVIRTSENNNSERMQMVIDTKEYESGQEAEADYSYPGERVRTSFIYMNVDGTYQWVHLTAN